MDLSFSVAWNDFIAMLQIRASLDFQNVFINFIFFKSLTLVHYLNHFKRNLNKYENMHLLSKCKEKPEYFPYLFLHMY